MNSADMVKLKSSVSLVELIREDVALVSVGREHKGLCPLHNDHNPSLCVYVDKADGAERWHCAPCQKGGDHFDWRREFHGESLQEAANTLQSRSGALTSTSTRVQAKAKKKKREWTAVMPPPDAPPPTTVWRGHDIGNVPVVNAYGYRLADGALISYVCRIEVGGHKEVIPHCWSKEDNRWRQKSLDIPRPLYQLHLLEGVDQVLVVEGEKACDAARILVPDLLCITWAGGCGAVKETDWTPLAGKEAWLWPDCDSKRYKETDPRAGEYLPYYEQPGAKAMAKIADILLRLGCTVHLVKVPDPGSDWRDGFDLADALDDGWTEQDVRKFMDEHSAAPDAPAADVQAPRALEDGPPLENMPPPLGDVAPPKKRKPRKQRAREGDPESWVREAQALGETEPESADVEPPRFSIEDAMPKTPDEVNEDRLCLLFEAIFHRNLRYCESTKAWYWWNGSTWGKEETLRVLDFARECCRHGAHSKTAYLKQSTASAIEKLARASRVFAVKPSIWDRHKLLLGTSTVTGNLESGETYTPRREDYITKQTAVGPAPPGTPCHVFDQFLDEATNHNPVFVRFLWQLFGYCLTGETNKHLMFFFYGAGGNGKSVLVNTMMGIMSEYATAAVIDTFTTSKSDRHSAELAMLDGMRLVVTNETEEGRSLAESKIKQVTSADPVKARHLYGQFHSIVMHMKLIIVGNHKPKLANVDPAMRRRIKLVPFNYTPAKPDEDLETKIRDEWTAILRRGIEGWLDVQANGFVYPQEVIDATEEYFDEQDFTGQWLKEQVVLGNTEQATRKDLHKDYEEYMTCLGEKPKTQTALTQELIKRGFKKGKVRGERGLKGIGLKSPDPVPDRREQPDNGWDYACKDD